MEYGDTSIFELLGKGLRKSPNEPAVIVVHQPPQHLAELVEVAGVSAQSGHRPSQCLSWTFTELHRAACRLASGMMAEGVKPGSTIVTLVPNCVEWFAVQWVSVLMKLTVVSVDPAAVQEPRNPELESYLTLNPDVILVADQDGALAIDYALQAVRTSKQPLRMQLDEDTADGWRSFLDIGREGIRAHIEERELVAEAGRDNPERVCQIVFTSGTSSGNPKGCPKTVKLTVNTLLIRAPDDAKPERYIVNTANFRVIAPGLTLTQWVTGGACIMPSESFEPQTTLDAIEMHKATILLLVPSMLYALRDHNSTPSRRLRGVQRVVLGGDMITRDTMMTAQKLFPGAKIVNGPGMTEGVASYKWPFHDVSVDELPYHGDICPIGEVAPGVKIRLWNDKKGRIVSRGEAGEIHMCSDRFIDHYLDNAHPEAFYSDVSGRWFKTGDLGLLTSNGLLYILDRIKDVIIRAGVNVVPAALEDCINGFTGGQSSVIGIPSAIYGHEPFAVLDSFGGETEEEVKRQVRDLFGEAYALAGVVSLEQLDLDRFPVNSTHKIMKIELLKIVELYLSKKRE
ncbi:acetyl-CoA synthetase-like protein [Teratosphaeria nubilosa]|uniref:Acetyl-CoA synthetase-like protein n=1 Tax=Teratosphaeria nubilosa TaxID=161662 RepID=A0A6G1L074_9PEZI|nr:acetyl-CoA synthetase-like protein [Teratosphaeria nubilosa]